MKNLICKHYDRRHHTKVMVKVIVWAFVLGSCSGCYDVVSHQIDMRNIMRIIEIETVVVDPQTHENFPNGKLGFVVYMNPEKAQSIGAPQSEEFTKLLDERLRQKELSVGYKICADGFVAGAKPFIGEHHIWFADYKCRDL